MKIVSIFLGLAICFTSLQADIKGPGRRGDRRSSVTSSGKKHGRDFAMLGTGAKNSIVLSNNIFYEPAHDHDAKISNTWAQGNIIRVYGTDAKNRYLLLNLSTGQTIKAKILKWD